MQHENGSFSEAAAVKKAWTRPVLTSTILTNAELNEALSSSENSRALGMRLKAQGRI